jgi:hypothetical protein
VITASGQWRSVRPTGANGRYLVLGFFNMDQILDVGRFLQPQMQTARCRCKRAVDGVGCLRALPSPPDGG